MNDILKPLTNGDGLYGVAGLYAIRHRSSGRTLICATENIGKRVWDELTRLRNKRHFNPLLAFDLQRDGTDAFEVRLVTTTLRPDLLKGLKGYYIDQTSMVGTVYNIRASSASFAR